MNFANKAAEFGARQYPWWPDWRGRYCAVIACGPSAKKANLAALKGRLPILAIKEAYDLAPFADAVYGCDYPWWDYRRGLRDFKGIKLSWDPRTRQNFPDVHQVYIADRNSVQILLETPLNIGSGRNSGFQALNLAAQFGVLGILAIGFDCDDRSGVHFYGRNHWAGSNNPARDNFERWRDGFASAGAFFLSRGVDVVNASPESAVTAFRKDSIEKTLRAWGINESQHLARV